MGKGDGDAPYYAVIFTSTLVAPSVDYEETADKMLELASEQPGFLGFESARDELGISISYWEDLAAIKAWKEHIAHELAQDRGKKEWYESYTTRICKVEREYHFSRST